MNIEQTASADCPVDLLDWYVNRTLDYEDRQRVELHLQTCSDCRHRIEALAETRLALHRAATLTPQPRTDLFAMVEACLDKPEAVPHLKVIREQLSFMWQLVHVQARLISRDLWPASLVVLIIGWVVAYILGAHQQTPSGAALAAIAPLIAGLGLSVIYGPDSDVGLELTMTSPTSPQQILLARFVLVFGYDLSLLLLLSVVFKLALPAVDLSALLELWLGPMFFLSSVGLLLSLVVGSNLAVVGSLIVWVIRVLALTDVGPGVHIAPLQFTAGFWSSTSVLIMLAVALLMSGFMLVKREERFL